MPRVTIDGLAERLGLSRAAISYALNGQPGVSDATRNRVLELALELGWQPNVSARSLSRSRADAVGLVLASPGGELGSEPYTLALVAGIESTAAEAGVALMLRFVAHDDEAETAVYRRWHAEHRVDGVLLVNLRTADPRPALLEELRLPYFVHGGRRADDGWQFDAHREAELLVAHLAELGHRRIGHVSGPQRFVHEAQRIAGIDAAAAARGIGAVHVESDYTYPGGRAATDRLLAADAPTAIVFSSDLMALGGDRALRERGAALASWDDSVLCLTAGITALQRDAFGAGRRSARILLDSLAGLSEAAYEWSSPPLIVRGSSRPAGRPAP